MAWDWPTIVGRAATIVFCLLVIYEVIRRIRKGESWRSWFTLSAVLLSVLNAALPWTPSGLLYSIIETAWLAALLWFGFIFIGEIVGANKELIESQDKLIELQGAVIAKQMILIAFYERCVAVSGDDEESEEDDDD